MRILGISAFYHDSAACLLEDGRIIAAAQEERFTRKKHDARFPENAIRYCLEAGSTDLVGIDYVTFYEKPFLKFDRLLETYIAFAPRGFHSFRMALPLWLKEKLYLKLLLRDELNKLGPKTDIESRLLFAEHHQSHAASAFFASPFKEAAILTMDGVGEWTTTSTGFGHGNHLEIQKEIHFPHSLGLLYSAFTYYLGFKVNSGEYKVMGLAPYGEPKFTDLITDNLIDIKGDGTFRLNMKYFNYCTGLTMTNGRFDNLFNEKPRQPDQELTQKHMNIAASIQQVTEMVMVHLTRSLQKETGARNLCLAGGVALNCVGNSKISRDGQFKRLWIQPAAGDAGGAVGAALATYYQYADKPRQETGSDAMSGSYLGPAYNQEEIEKRLTAAGARFECYDDDRLIAIIVMALLSEKVVGWFQGRMEFGPRALGARSILADPRNPSMQKNLNLRIKYRESFRPFAPAVLQEDSAQWFTLEDESPYMLMVADVVPEKRREIQVDEKAFLGIDKLKVARSEIPAVTHVDYSARVQTVHRQTNPQFHKLLTAFKEKTGCPVLINTSFNVRGEPIVCTPEDAFRCFMGTGIEVLAIGNCVLHKEQQNNSLRLSYSEAFDPD
ncbi:MAG: carbamoyltransferase [Deltaproteobacteria bacterium]|nr:carbamoyltransferase [Deltaproteobacteria bacterium]